MRLDLLAINTFPNVAALGAGRAAPPVAIDPAIAASQTFEAHVDPIAMLGAFTSLAPILLGVHWWMELEESRAAAELAGSREEVEYLRCLNGEGCALTCEPRHRPATSHRPARPHLSARTGAAQTRSASSSTPTPSPPSSTPSSSSWLAPPRRCCSR